MFRWDGRKEEDVDMLSMLSSVACSLCILELPVDVSSCRCMNDDTLRLYLNRRC